MAQVEQIFRDNDHILRLDELKDVGLDSFINDASVVATLKDADGNDVSGQTWPATMTYVVASDGRYEATLENALDIDPGTFYEAFIVATKDSLVGTWELKMQGMRRRS